MTDHNDFVAGQLGQQAGSVLGQGASEEEIAGAAAAHAGSGVTEADLDGIKALLAQFQRRLDAAEAQRQQLAPDALTSSVTALQTQLDNHGDPVAIELGKDAFEAAKSAAETGELGPLAAIAAKIAEHLRRHPAGPGDQFHYRQVLDTAAQHIPDVIEAFRPQAAAGQELASTRPPAKVVAGSVVG
jgi:hypothetical protein